MFIDFHRKADYQRKDGNSVMVWRSHVLTDNEADLSDIGKKSVELVRRYMPQSKYSRNDEVTVLMITEKS